MIRHVIIIVSLFLYSQATIAQDELDENWNQIDSLVSVANQQIQSKQYALANETCDQLLQIYEGPGAHLLKAQAIMEGRKIFSSDLNVYEVANFHLNEALKMDSLYYRAYGRKGLLNIIYHDFEAAVENYTLFLNYATDSTEIFNGLTDRGTAKAYSGKIDSAIDDYYLAMEIDSTHYSIYQNLGAMLIDAERYTEANDVLQKGLSLYPTDLGILNNIGFLNLEQENYNTAIQFFDKVIELEPNSFLALGNRGFCKLKTNDIDGAQSDMDRSMAINPENPYIYKYFGLLYLEIKTPMDACLQFSMALHLGFTAIYGDEVETLIFLHCD